MVNKDFINALRDKARDHREMAELLDKAADKYESLINQEFSDLYTRASHDMKKNKKGNKQQDFKGTFKEAILHIFSDKKPRVAKKIYKDFLFLTKKDLKESSFSGQLSQIKRSGVISMYENKELPNDKRFVYGLPDWFTDSGNLKEEYKMINLED